MLHMNPCHSKNEDWNGREGPQTLGYCVHALASSDTSRVVSRRQHQTADRESKDYDAPVDKGENVEVVEQDNDQHKRQLFLAPCPGSEHSSAGSCSLFLCRASGKHATTCQGSAKTYCAKAQCPYVKDALPNTRDIDSTLDSWKTKRYCMKTSKAALRR